MEYLLLTGVFINYAGALKLSAQLFKQTAILEEHLQLKLFVIGVAITFGTLYLYLFFNPQYINPILWFGASLKAWAFISCLALWLKSRISLPLFYEFGVSNGIVALLFITLLMQQP